MSRNISRPYASAPVSYTHLDVYKRQPVPTGNHLVHRTAHVQVNPVGRKSADDLRRLRQCVRLMPEELNAGRPLQIVNFAQFAACLLYTSGQGQQESGLPPKKNGKGGRAVRRKLLYAAAVVVLLVLVGVKLGFGRGTEQTGEPTLTAVQAQRGDIAVSVSGSGTVQPLSLIHIS